MNYTILGDMYSNANIPYTYAEGNVTLSSKAAKLNGETKRPTLVNNWITKRPNLTVNQTNELKEMNTIVSDVASSTHGYDVVLSGLGLALAKHDAMSTVSGFRKLKVNRVVNDKTRKVYDTLDDKVIVQVANQNDINTVIKDEMINESIKMPQVEETVRDVPTINYKAMAPVSETRTAKHEYDLGEQPNIINTPERFQNASVNNISLNEGSHVANNMSRVEKNSYPLENDNNISKVMVGADGKRLDRINELNHGNDGIPDETKRIKEETNNIITATDQLNKKNKMLAEQIKACEQEYARVNAKRAVQANEKAKKAYTLAKRENDDATHVYRDLTEKLKVLRAKVEAAQNSLNEDDEDSYGGMRMAA